MDRFVLYDDMQYTKRDWRNRNVIKTPQGPKWLTIPVEVKGKFHQKINETKISDDSWAQGHIAQLQQNYRNSNFYVSELGWVEELFAEMSQHDMLSDVNRKCIEIINKRLGITTELIDSRMVTLIDGKTERLVSICEELGAKTYVSGPAAKDYLDESLFLSKGISVEYFDNNGYQEYEQLFPPFSHYVTILDLFFNVGDEAVNLMKYAR